MFAILHAASASPDLVDKIAASEKKIESGMNDLVQLAVADTKRKGADLSSAMQIGHAAEQPLCELDHLGELLLIDSVVQNDNAKRKVQDLIRYHVKHLAESVDRSVAIINVALAERHNQAIILAATKLRDDLRESKNLPKTPDTP